MINSDLKENSQLSQQASVEACEMRLGQHRVIFWPLYNYSVI